MDQDRYARARAVFFEALDVPAADRREFVSRQCGEDDALRHEVDLLLAALDDDAGALGSVGPGQELRSMLDRAVDARQDALAPGLPRRIGRHDVIGCLGEGGMGVVYEAEQRQPRRRVAIKLLRPGLVTPDFIESFKREADLLGRLHHPGIASVFEAGQARPWGRSGPELPYLVMELIEGLPITTHATKARLGIRERLELVALTCDAVQHAHDRGVVHRDLKPPNILVDETGQPRVLDFGVAAALELDASEGSAAVGARRAVAGSHRVGTLSYMSPEQLRADAGADGDADGGRSGPSCDVYALGVVAYELLAGRLPLQLVGLDLGEAVRRVREVDPPRLGTVDRRLRGDIESLVGKALEKDPSRRYSSPAHLSADVRRHLAHEPILARRPRAGYRALKFARRNRALVASMAAVLLVLLAGGITSAALAVRAARAQRVAEAHAAEARRANYRAQLGAAIAALREGDALTAEQHLDAAPTELREWTWRHLRASTDDALDVLRPEVREKPSLTAAGERLVVHGGDGISVLARDGERLRLAGHRTGRFIAVAPDGSAAIEARGERWLLHDTSDLSLRPQDLGGPAGATALPLPGGAWALDAGGTLVVVDAQGSVRTLGVPAASLMLALADGTALVVAGPASVDLVPLSGGAPRRVQSRRASALATGDANRVLLVGDEEGEVHCSRLDGTDCAWSSVRAGRQRVVSMAVDPAGRHFVAVDRSGRVTSWSLATGAPLGLAVTLGHDSARAFLSPDGAVVLLPRLSGRIDAVTPEGTVAALPRVGHATTVASVAWIADLVASVDTDGVLRTFQSPLTPDRRRLAGHEAYVYSVQFFPDGRHLVSTAWDGTVRTWDGFTGAALATWRPGERVGRVVRVVDQGRRVVSLVDGTLILTDTATGAQMARREGMALDMDATDEAVVAVEIEGEIVVRDAALARELARIPSLGGSAADARRGSAGAAGTIAVSAGPLVKELDLDRAGEHDGQRELWTAASMLGDVLDLARDAQGRFVAGSCRDGGIALWDARTGVLVREMRASGGATLCAAFDATGRQIVAGSHDGSVQVWDVERGELVARIPIHDDYVREVAFSPDGSILATASGDTTLRVLDTVRVRDRRLTRSTTTGSPGPATTASPGPDDDRLTSGRQATPRP